jgi:hypothetical protein
MSTEHVEQGNSTVHIFLVLLRLAGHRNMIILMFNCACSLKETSSEKFYCSRKEYAPL